MAIIQNAVYLINEDRYVVSRHRHDYVTFEVDGTTHFLDGGTDYQRKSFVVPPYGVEDLTLYDDSPMCDIRRKYLWGTYGKDGNEPFRWIRIRDMEFPHIEAILNDEKAGRLQIGQVMRNALCYELSDRMACSHVISIVMLNELFPS